MSRTLAGKRSKYKILSAYNSKLINFSFIRISFEPYLVVAKTKRCGFFQIYWGHHQCQRHYHWNWYKSSFDSRVIFFLVYPKKSFYFYIIFRLKVHACMQQPLAVLNQTKNFLSLPWLSLYYEMISIIRYKNNHKSVENIFSFLLH